MTTDKALKEVSTGIQVAVLHGTTNPVILSVASDDKYWTAVKCPNGIGYVEITGEW